MQEKAEAATTKALRTLTSPLKRERRVEPDKVDLSADGAIAAALASQAAAAVPTATSAQGPRTRVTQSIDMDYEDAPTQTGSVSLNSCPDSCPRAPAPVYFIEH